MSEIHTKNVFPRPRPMVESDREFKTLGQAIIAQIVQCLNEHVPLDQTLARLEGAAKANMVTNHHFVEAKHVTRQPKFHHDYKHALCVVIADTSGNSRTVVDVGLLDPWWLHAVSPSSSTPVPTSTPVSVPVSRSSTAIQNQKVFRDLLEQEVEACARRQTSIIDTEHELLMLARVNPILNYTARSVKFDPGTTTGPYPTKPSFNVNLFDYNMRAGWTMAIEATDPWWLMIHANALTHQHANQQQTLLSLMEQLVIGNAQRKISVNDTLRDLRNLINANPLPGHYLVGPHLPGLQFVSSMGLLPRFKAVFKSSPTSNEVILNVLATDPWWITAAQAQPATTNSQQAVVSILAGPSGSLSDQDKLKQMLQHVLNFATSMDNFDDVKRMLTHAAIAYMLPVVTLGDIDYQPETDHVSVQLKSLTLGVGLMQWIHLPVGDALWKPSDKASTDTVTIRKTIRDELAACEADGEPRANTKLRITRCVQPYIDSKQYSLEWVAIEKDPTANPQPFNLSVGLLDNGSGGNGTIHVSIPILKPWW